MTKTTYKVGDKVRILDVKNIIGGETHWDNGDIVKVTKVEGRIWLERKKTKPSPQKPFLHDNELKYIELVSPKPTKNQRISTLEQKIEAMQAEIDALKATKKSPVIKIADAVKLTPNEQRKAIIDEAKSFVMETERKMRAWKSNNEGNYTYRNRCTFAKYHINTEKRIVMALVRHEETLELLEKAIAKCNPSDVFNTDIGKAIALGRALGLDVSKFEKAVQPSEVVVGQVVTNTEHSFWGAGTVKEIEKPCAYRGYRVSEDDSFNYLKTAVILHDSEAQY
ncbi:hypothetical protein [Lysinibacillus fusiformis]|uniref:hypothetical protein n=1 Tax=Lysinibacillus fusiformis TaxID=28031 RepID=UPI0030177640